MTDWENCYREKDTPWDKGEAAPPLREYLSRHKLSGRVLLPGCGRGHDARLLASHGCDVTGLDISQKAIEEAEILSQGDRVNYIVADFFQLPKVLTGVFDGIVEHTCFCAIHLEQRSLYLDSVLQALHGEGWLLGVFFIETNNKDNEGPPWSVSSEELDRFFSKDFELIECYTAKHTYESRKDCTEEVRLMKRKPARLG